MSKHNEIGVKGEVLALEFLEKKGYSVAEINWKCGKREIDIIARDGKTLVFIEVKTRTGNRFGMPEDAVSVSKQTYLATAAEEYLALNNLNVDVRFDVVSITFTDRKPKLHHIRDAFFPYDEP